MNFSGRFLFLASAAALLAATPASADVKSGVDRWMRGDYAGAITEWRPLADRGDADAQFNLGQAYKMGRGVTVNPRLAQSWYEKAAKQGHEQAQVNVGLLLYNSGRRQEALPWIRKAVEIGDPRAQYILGTELFNGDIVAKDWPRAYALMLLAADRELAPAADNIKAMDVHIPLEQRQQGVKLAGTLGRSGGSSAFAGMTPHKPRVAGSVGKTAVPASRPAAVPAPAPTRAATGGAGWKVQLGAFGTPANAQRAWAGLSAKVRALAPLQPRYVPAGAVTRLQAGPLPTRAAAEGACAAAKAAGSACFPVAP